MRSFSPLLVPGALTLPNRCLRWPLRLRKEFRTVSRIDSFGSSGCSAAAVVESLRGGVLSQDGVHVPLTAQIPMWAATALPHHAPLLPTDTRTPRSAQYVALAVGRIACLGRGASDPLNLATAHVRYGWLNEQRLPCLVNMRLLFFKSWAIAC